MKTFETIRADKRLTVVTKGEDGGTGWVTIRGKNIYVIYSNGGGWDHVSASTMNRCPTWEEMCQVKDIFFNDDECCVEYHPAKKDYVNIHDYCLHIWKPQKEQIPMPQKIFV